jgi:hypothetical protein
MNLYNYKSIISNLPVRQQCFTTKRNTWLKAEKEIPWLTGMNNILFDNQETYMLLVVRIFSTQFVHLES